MSDPLGTTESLPVFDFDTGAGTDKHPAIGVMFADAGGHSVVSAATPLPVTNTSVDEDDDDNAVAEGQTLPLVIVENYVHDGSGWIRAQGAVDNAPAPNAGLPQLMFTGGVARSALPAYTNLDAATFTFDLTGRLQVNAEGVTDDDDDAIAVGQTTSLGITIPYVSNLDNAGVWERHTARDDDDAIPFGDGSPTSIGLTHVSDGTDWGRLEGVRDNEAAPATPRGSFTEGVAQTAFPAFTAGDGVVDRFTDEGAKIVIRREQEPFELLLSQVALAASGSVAGTIQQNSLFAGSLGRTLLHGLVNYAGTASSLTVTVEISLDAGATFITVDSFTVLSGTPLVVRELDVALGNRVRVTVTNNDGANATGVTNIYFALTQNN